MSRRTATGLTIVGAALVITGVAFLFWQLALIVAGVAVAAIGLVGVDVEEGSR